MYVSVLVSFCWCVFSSSFPYFLFIFIVFNDFGLFPYRFHDIYFKKPSEFNDVSYKVEPSELNITGRLPSVKLVIQDLKPNFA